MKYWVYEHIFPNGKRYIGLTTKTNPKRRWRNGGLAYKGQFVFKAIQKYGWKNIKHLLYECDSEKEMKYLERYLIAYYDTTNSKNGYNITPGGEYFANFTGHKHTESTKKLLSQKSLGHICPFAGTNLSEEWKKKIQNSSWQNCRNVYQYSLEDGSFIREWPSVNWAHKELGIDRRSISRVCSGRYKSAGGYGWSYEMLEHYPTKEELKILFSEKMSRLKYEWWKNK